MTDVHNLHVFRHAVAVVAHLVLEVVKEHRLQLHVQVAIIVVVVDVLVIVRVLAETTVLVHV